MARTKKIKDNNTGTEVELLTTEGVSSVIKAAKKEKFRIFMGNDPRLDIHKIPFDIPQLDTILGGGLPLGRTVLAVGNFGSGKTFFSQLAMANYQRKGLSTAYVDIERRYDRTWFSKSGVDCDKLLVAQPHSGENALDICLLLIEQKVALVVVDSVAAMSATAELEGSMEDNTMAALARMLNKGLRKITAENICSEDMTFKGTTFLLINQMRSGMGPFTTYSLPGGVGQQYLSSIILRIMRGSRMEEGDGDKKKILGFNMKFVTDKNNLTEWPQECHLPFLVSGVIDTVGGLVELAIDLEIIKQAGPYYYFTGDENNKIMGKLALVEKVKADVNLQEEIKKRVYAS